MADSTESLQDRYERYAMHAEELSQKEKTWLDVDKVGADLGISQLESRKVADLLIDAGWVTPHPSEFPESPKIRMTKTGFDEVAKLCWPWHRRWIDKNRALFGWIVGILTGVAGAVVGALLIEYFKRLFWPAPGN
jgi:hypothetical protein